MFTPLQKQSASADCATALRKAIVSGQLPAGSRLPPERKLAEEFGVNRLTLRSALSQLLANGLLSVRQGSGYTVADLQRVCGPDLLPDLLQMAREEGKLLGLIGELLEVRRALASCLLGRLSEVATEQSLIEISATIDDFEKLIGVGDISVVQFARADLRIVAAMANGAQSPILRLCLNPVVAAVEQLGELNQAMYIDPEDNLAGHRLLHSWLCNPSLAPLSQILLALAERDRRTLSNLRFLEEHS